MAQRRWERTASAPEERADREAEEGSASTEGGEGREGVAATVGVVGEVTAPPGVRKATVEGEVGAKDMEVGGEEMDEGEVEVVDGDDVEAEGGVLGGEGILALEATGLLTQDKESGSTTIVDAQNG